MPKRGVVTARNEILSSLSNQEPPSGNVAFERGMIPIDANSIIASMSDGVLAVDTSGIVLLCNDKFQILFQIGGQIVGQKLNSTIADGAISAVVNNTIVSGESVETEITLDTGKLSVYSIRATPLVDGRGSISGAVVVCSDITQLRRLEVVRQEFVANVSHELKTPITAIVGFAETLLSGAVVEKEDLFRYTGIIARQAQRLRSIVDDLLKLSRLEQESSVSKLDLSLEPVCEILRDAAELCSAKAAEKGVSFEFDCSSTLSVRVDRSLFGQAVVNLVDNAIKYSKADGVIVFTAKVFDDEIALSVKDFGAGIDPSHIPRLFERFYRVDKGRSRDLGGTGLGLAIVKHVAQVHGGRVTASSELGKGSDFTLWLPRP